MIEDKNMMTGIETDANSAEKTSGKLNAIFENIKKTHTEMFNRIREGLSHTPNSGGKKQLLRYVNGTILHRSDAMTAKCCDCMGNYVDGLRDCQVYICPMYPYMPYGVLKQRYQRPEVREKENI